MNRIKTSLRNSHRRNDGNFLGGLFILGLLLGVSSFGFYHYLALMKIRLELAHKKAKVKKVQLKADTIIGRSTDCGLRIASNEVSRQHCKICIGETEVTVRDLGSSNGTFVNGYQLEPDTDYEIAPDSELALGGIKFFVRFSESAEKVMQSDGLGSTVDLKPGQKEELAALEKSAAEPEPDEDEIHFTEATESDEEHANEEEVAETESEEAAEEDLPATVNMKRPLDVRSVMEDGDHEVEFEMSTHGDSAILETEATETETEAATSDASEEEVADRDFDEPNVPEVAQEVEVKERADNEPESNTSEEEVVDLEFDNEDSEPPEVAEVVDREIEEEEPERVEVEEVVDRDFDEEDSEPGEVEEVAHDDVEEAESEVEMELDEADEDIEEESEVEMELESEEEPVAATEVAVDIPEPADDEMSEDDVADFLNQVSDEDEGADNEDESLGDFFKQFD